MSEVVDCPDLRGRSGVFADREEAGELLADLVESGGEAGARVFAIPAGGVPVGAVLAQRLGVPLELCVVSKITYPWNREAGYGAVAFDGGVSVSEGAAARAGLSAEDIDAGIAEAREKVARRVRRWGGASLRLGGAVAAIVVDDGLASGRTMQAALEALRRAGAEDLVVAVPTAHEAALAALAPQVRVVYCANRRGGESFAVADAYREWRDLGEDEVAAYLREDAAPPA